MLTTEETIALEGRYGATNYAPLPVVLCRGEGVYVWDPEGRRYLDFLSGICAVSQGHCHPRLVATLVEQAKRLTLVSRAFYSDRFAPFAKLATEYFGYERVLAMNTGVEAFETAVKLCRSWGYKKKGIAEGAAKLVFCANNFHGRTLAAVSASGNAEAAKKFGPFVPGFLTIPYGDTTALAEVLKDRTVAGFIIEPIQGEGGVNVPPEGYLTAARELCRSAEVLFIADEIQTGIGRTGRRLACDRENVRPDIVILGKALSGGMMPISAILADDSVMSCFQPGDHGSTFGGNPLACAIAMTALEIVRDEKLAENAEKMGALFRDGLSALKLDRLLEVRGRGLLNAVVIDKTKGVLGGDLCLRLLAQGMLAKNTRDDVIRFAPPLTINEEQIRSGLAAIQSALA